MITKQGEESHPIFKGSLPVLNSVLLPLYNLHSLLYFATHSDRAVKLNKDI